MRAEGASERSVERRSERRKKEEAREREKKKERDGGTLACKQRGYAAPLLSSSLSSSLLSAPLLRSVRSTNSLARSLARARRAPSRPPSLSVPFVTEPSVPLRPSLYTPFGVSLFFLFRVYTYVRACTRVACVFVDRWPRDAEGRIFFRMGYLTRWPGQ